MASSSLSNVVSSLVRGSPNSSTVTDEDLDRHIGEIILREAKAKAERYKKEGIKAYLPPTDPNVPKPNKRFLNSIIKNTDEHNKAIQRVQDQFKQERDEQERKERMRRAKEAAAVRRTRKSERQPHYSGSGLSEDRWRPDDDDDRDYERRRRKRNWENSFEEEDEEGRRSKERPASSKRYWDEDVDEYEERMRRRKQRRTEKNDSKEKRHQLVPQSPDPLELHSFTPPRSRSRSPSRSPTRHERSKFRNKATADYEDIMGSKQERRRRRHGSSSYKIDTHTRRKISPSSSPSRNNSNIDDPGQELRKPKARSQSPAAEFEPKVKDQNRGKRGSRPPSPLIEPPSLPPSPPPPPSKMDKYFEPNYDPRLDVAPLTSGGRLTVNVPATGLINDPSWDSWETMLELIKLKREDKIEKKRLERLGLLPEERKSTGGSGKKGKGMVSASVPGEDRGLMDIAYTKRGTVREWDMGKEIG